jgi:hypothetical protein
MKLGLYSITYLGLWYRDIGYAHQQAHLAAEFMRDLIASADRSEPLSALNTTTGATIDATTGATSGRPA